MSMVGYTHAMQPFVWRVETLDMTGFFNICYSNIEMSQFSSSLVAHVDGRSS